MPIATHAATVTLREITQDSVRAFCRLQVTTAQAALVAPNAVSIAQAHFHPEAWFRGIYADDKPVGFAMLEDWTQIADEKSHHYEGAPTVALWRFMIDAGDQHCGYGTAALRLLIAHAATRPGVENMLLSFVPAAANPEAFYQRFGFTRTGDIEAGEVVMKRPLGGSFLLR